MKRFILSTLMFLVTAVSIRAARAYSEPFTISQPDGTQLTITLHGDEHISWLTTSDGTMVVETPKGYFVASIEDNGRLKATRFLAHQPNQRSTEEAQECQKQQQRKALFHNEVKRTWKAIRRAQVTSSAYFPHSGSPKCLVVLVDFQDVKFSADDPVAQFEQYFNGDVQKDMGHEENLNLVGVKKYFELSSQGQFTPQFDVVGPFTLSQTMEYYGANNESDGSKDVNFNQFCSEAIAAADNVVNFADYDNSGNGNAELVCIIYAGYGESVSGNPSNTIWPKCGYRGITTNDEVKVSYINCSPELRHVNADNRINGIGVFCHEFSHGMGLPDLYATNIEAQLNNQSPEFFDLMDYGEYASNGYAPTPYSAWEHDAFGWANVEQLSESQTNIELKSLMQGGKAYKFSNGADSNEWIMIENVQPADRENRIPGFPYGHGMLVWHIAHKRDEVRMNDYPNNEPYLPRVCIVPASGFLINGYLFGGEDKPYTQAEYLASLKAATFPGTSEVTTLTAEQQLPNYIFYNGDETPVFKLLNIAEDAETRIVTFDFDSGTLDAMPTISKISEDTGNNYYSPDGRNMGHDYRQLPKGLYIRNGKKINKGTSGIY